MYRFRKGQREFNNFKHSAECGLCDPSQLLILQEHPNFFVVHNRFPYNIWEGRDVIDHLMIVPKRHLSGFGEFSAKEQQEAYGLIAEYESQGYNVYARSLENTERSVAAHQHTHLIKTKLKRPKITLYWAKPHLVIKR